MSQDTPKQPALRQFVRRVVDLWATRSLAIGALATILDICVGLTCVKGLDLGTRFGAMTGVAVGATFTFFANRFIAFREHNPKLASPAFRFILATSLAMLVHGQLVVFLRDGLGVPFVPAKMLADVAVFSVGQLLLLRYVVFPSSVEG